MRLDQGDMSAAAAARASAPDDASLPSPPLDTEAFLRGGGSVSQLPKPESDNDDVDTDDDEDIPKDGLLFRPWDSLVRGAGTPTNRGDPSCPEYSQIVGKRFRVERPELGPSGTLYQVTHVEVGDYDDDDGNAVPIAFCVDPECDRLPGRASQPQQERTASAGDNGKGDACFSAHEVEAWIEQYEGLVHDHAQQEILRMSQNGHTRALHKRFWTLPKFDSKGTVEQRPTEFLAVVTRVGEDYGRYIFITEWSRVKGPSAFVKYRDANGTVDKFTASKGGLLSKFEAAGPVHSERYSLNVVLMSLPVGASVLGRQPPQSSLSKAIPHLRVKVHGKPAVVARAATETVVVTYDDRRIGESLKLDEFLRLCRSGKAVWFLHKERNAAASGNSAAAKKPKKAASDEDNDWDPRPDPGDLDQGGDLDKEGGGGADDPAEAFDDDIGDGGDEEDYRSEKQRTHTSMADAVHDPFLVREIRRVLATLPKMYRWAPVASRTPTSFHEIRDHMNIPITNCLHTNVREYDGLGSTCVYKSLAIICPHLFCRNSVPDRFSCVDCGSNSSVRMCGFAKGVRTLVGIGHYTAVLVRQYRCEGCSEAAKKGKKSRYFTALHPGVLKQCQPAYRQSIPFRVLPRLLVDLCVLDMLNSLRISGTSFNAFSRASRWSLETAHYRRWLVHDHQLLWARSTLVFGDAPVNMASNRFRQFKGKFIGPKLAKRIFMEDFYRRLSATSAYLGSFVGDVVKIDYTYWATKFVREGAQMVAKAQFGMVSEA